MLDIVVQYLNNENFDNAVTKNNSKSQKNECEVIKSLKENGSVVIKEADKGGAVIVINKTHYYSMIVKFLQDEETYKKTMKIVTKNFSETLKNLLPHSAIVY